MWRRGQASTVNHESSLVERAMSHSHVKLPEGYSRYSPASFQPFQHHDHTGSHQLTRHELTLQLEEQTLRNEVLGEKSLGLGELQTAPVDPILFGHMISHDITWYHMISPFKSTSSILILTWFTSSSLHAHPKVRHTILHDFAIHSVATVCHRMLVIWGFPWSWGYPHSKMVYKGKSHWNGWFRGTPILGKPPFVDGFLHYPKDIPARPGIPVAGCQQPVKKRWAVPERRWPMSWET